MSTTNAPLAVWKIRRGTDSASVTTDAVIDSLLDSITQIDKVSGPRAAALNKQIKESGAYGVAFPIKDGHAAPVWFGAYVSRLLSLDGFRISVLDDLGDQGVRAREVCKAYMQAVLALVYPLQVVRDAMKRPEAYAGVDFSADIYAAADKFLGEYKRLLPQDFSRLEATGEARDVVICQGLHALRGWGIPQLQVDEVWEKYWTLLAKAQASINAAVKAAVQSTSTTPLVTPQ